MQSAVVIEIASFLAGPFYDFNFSVQIQFVSTVSHPFRLVNFHFNIVPRNRKVKPETAIAHEVVLSSRGLPVPNQSLSRF